jgi:2-(1,2-epoxy-1,2-dihydrophenyl)acetyl-CoA isomerase
MAYDRVGASPDCSGTYELPRAAPHRSTQSGAVQPFGEILDAEQALSIGVVNQAVPADQLDAQAQLWADKVASGPTQAYGHYKRLVQQSHTATLSEQLEAERIAFKASTTTDDFRAGVR